MNHVGKPWVIVLAGGSGVRLHPVTTPPSGRSVPKQFCRLDGRNSMLGVTLARARTLAPVNQIAVVVVDEHRPWWERELAGIPPGNVLIQSRNRGTALALLHALLHVRGSDPEACVVVLPSDHVVDHEHILNEAILEAVHEAKRCQGHVVLIGAASTVPDPSLGWIIPGRKSAGRIHKVRRFVEKPSLAVADECVRRGALRNTLMLAASIPALLKTYALAMPAWVDATDADDDGLHARARALTTISSDLPAMDLSRDILQWSTRGLRVLPLPECGWTDIGTLDRLEAWWMRHPTAFEEVRQSGVLPHAPWTPPSIRPRPARDVGAYDRNEPAFAGHEHLNEETAELIGR
ncbi:MAG TPA: sugar phosphate nucleotidyltransferase [Candidatus Eisenbacteria bacterium]|nr:sugar phosphate nucleotidyltransferase [Candidatus Eisenbacteria bacterium]